MRDVACWTCLDFGDLAGLGPCPDCQPDAHAGHVLAELAATNRRHRRRGPMSEQLDALLARMGYIHRDHVSGQDLERHANTASDQERAPYPQVVMVQGHSAGESWVRDHAGQLMLAAGAGVFGLAALAVVALVAIVTAVALVVITASVTILGGVAASQGRGKR